MIKITLGLYYYNRNKEKKQHILNNIWRVIQANIIM